MLKLVLHSPPPSPPHNQPQRLELIAVGSSSHFLLNLILMPSRPNPTHSLVHLRLGLGHNCSSFCVACIISQLLLTPYFMFQTLHSKFNSGVFRILEEIQIFYVQNNSKTFFYINQDLEFISNCYSQTKQCSFTPYTSFYRRNHLGMKIFNIKICNFFSLKKILQLGIHFFIKNIFVHTFNLAMIKNWRNHLPMAKFLH